MSRFVTFSRAEWSVLRASTPMTLSADDLTHLQGLNEDVSIDEVADVYLPLSRLLNLYVAAAQHLHSVTDNFLGKPAAKVPYVIGLAGSVAVGKSTTARILAALLRRWPNHPRVDLVTTDGFLFPNAVLEDRGIMLRKGFPESYDVRRLVQFLAEVKAGEPRVSAPVYSHEVYDIVADEVVTVEQPDILIVEGLNVLQTDGGYGPFVSDFFDFSIYVDADETDIEDWYLERFRTLRRLAVDDPAAYFHRFVDLDDDAADAFAHHIWGEVNGRNLADNIAPTRERATLILGKGADHSVRTIRLRRL